MPRHTVLQTSMNIQKGPNISTLIQKKPTNDANSTKRQATSPAKGAFQKRSALGNISNVAHLPNLANCQEPLKPNQPKKENVCRRRSLRLQEKTALTNPLTSQKTKSEPKKQLADKKLYNSPRENAVSNHDVVNRDILELSPLPTHFYEHYASPRRRRLDFVDFDLTNACNVNEAPDYAFTVFEYTRTRESRFVLKAGYLSQMQTELTADMRAILVDWMVEVQENFELNHETLYLAVKLVDHYLQEVCVSREKLQLVGATSLLVAAKFDERHPPCIDEFLYICDDTYIRDDILSMERAILIRIGFDINIPISYRFLRRYAKCTKASMETLTLARFVLELSLQCYALVDRSASLLAASALWLAMKMKKSKQEWNDTFVYYTSRREDEVLKLAIRLNAMVIESKAKKLKTIWQKYSHSIFYEVAKTPTLSDERVEAERTRVQSQARSPKET